MQFVIPDLVSEERAESVGNPCLDGEGIRVGSDSRPEGKLLNLLVFSAPNGFTSASLGAQPECASPETEADIEILVGRRRRGLGSRFAVA
jgi:hypothetical protein